MSLVGAIEFYNFVYGKSVALVGGAKLWDRETAESCDLMIRCNEHFADQGGRVDVLYHAGNPPDRSILIELERVEVKFMQLPLVFCFDGFIAEYCDKRNIPYELWGRTRYQAHRGEKPEYEWTNSFYRELGTDPFTGVFAIEHLLRQPINKLFITGMDFYANDNNGVIPERIGCHELMPQIRYLAPRIQNDARVTCDFVLKGVLS